MKRTGKLITLVLVVAMALSLMSVAALAADSSDYEDVVAGKWYVQYVDWALDEGLMTGISDKEWAPNTATTRGMVITTLYALAGKPEVEGDSPFADVEEGKYYTDAVKWAVEAGVASGKSGDKFDPTGVLTREEAATFFCAFAKNVWKLDVSDTSGMNKFPDKDDVSNYAKDAMGWAVKANVISGSKENGVVKLMPKRDITRAELATMLKALKALEPQPEPDPSETVAPATVDFSDITVTVKSEDDKENVKGKTVHIRGVDKNGNPVTVGGVTDKHGVVTFKHVPVSGEKPYEIWEDGVDTTLFIDVGTFKNPKTVKVTEATTEIELVHQFKKKLVRVAVKTEDVWSTLEGIEVKLSGKADNGDEISTVSSTDKQGRADFNVPAGKYTAEFNNLPDAYIGDSAKIEIDQKYPFTFDEDEDVMEATPSAWYTLNIKLKTCDFEVALIDEDEKPVKINNVKLTLSGKLASGTRAPRNSVVTDQNGVAKFNGIPYSDADGFTMTVVNKTLRAGDNEYEVVEIRTNPVVVNAPTHDKVYVVLKKVTKGIVNVNVVNDEGTPLTDVEVRLRDEAGNIVKRDLSDDDGVVSFKNIDAGKYFIDYDKAISGYTIDADNLVDQKLVDKKTGNELPVEVENKKTVEKTLVYNHDVGNLKVTVLDDETGEPVKNVVVQASVWGHAYAGEDADAIYNSQQTDLKGIAQFNNDDIFTGVYFLSIKDAPEQYSKEDFVCEPVLVAVEKDTTAEATIKLKKAVGSVKIQVVKDDEEARTITGLQLMISGKAADGSSVSEKAITDKDGYAAFNGVKVGSYKLSVIPADGDKEKGQEYKLVDDTTVVIKEGSNKAVVVKAKLIGSEDA